VLRLKVIAISSVAASNWGANIPELTWLDLERILHEQGLTSHRSVAASLGGEGDKALGMKQESREMLRSAIKRNGVRLIEIDTLKENIDKKISIYKEFSEGKRISAYVNVGGGTVAVGSVKGKKLYQPGLNKKPLAEALRVDSVMSRFAREGIPVIHIVYIDRLAEKYGLSKSPQVLSHCDFTIELRVYVWVPDVNEGWRTGFWLLENIKKRFDREGVEIPFH
jgi:poly-gamma-glutamate system protein